VLVIVIIFNPYIMHQKNAGKQTMASGIAIPFKKLRKISEVQANKAKMIAARAIFR